jgi:DegV family protein with EDD domain
MAKIRLVTDSTSDIPETVRRQYGIEMVPLKVHFGEETYEDGITIHPGEFYDKLAAASALPTTSQPSPADFLDIYKKVTAEPGVEIISVHLSSAFSGTYQSAVLAKSLMEGEADITVVDSKSASYGIGLLVVEAAKAAEAGRSKEEIVALIDKLRREMRIYFLVDTLEYLKKGGRIGKAAALVGSLLQIKPILTIDDDGEVASVEKVRGQKKAMSRIAELLKHDFGERELQVAVADAKSPDSADELVALLKSNLNIASLTRCEVGPVIGTHTGPGVVAAFAYPAP